jgi:hypothetical protein
MRAAACLQGVALRGRQAIEGLAQGVRSQLEFGYAGRLERVEATRVLEHRRITARAHVGQNLRDARFDVRVGLGRPVQARREARLEIRICAVQPQWAGQESICHGHGFHCRRALRDRLRKGLQHGGGCARA